MLSRLIIENFRSIKNLDIPLGPVNVFVGPNNSGKTAILEALNLLLGETYPSVRSFDERDYHMHDVTLPIAITAFLDAPIQVQDVFRRDHEAWGFQIKLTRYQRGSGRAQAGDPKFNYTMIDAKGTTLQTVQRRPAPGGRPFPEQVRVSNDLRDQFPTLFVGIDRSIVAQLRGYQRTFMGRILRELNKQFASDDTRVASFAAKMDEATQVLRTNAFQGFEKTFREHVSSLTGLSDLTLGFRSFDPLDHYRLLELYVRETAGGLEFLPDEMGSGTQSALAVALVRAYAQIVKQSAALVIEEPELFLHPHSCRFFDRSLRELADTGVQVFYSTHSPTFVDLGSYDSLYVVRRSVGGDTQVARGRDLTLAAGDMERLRLHSRFDTSRNEVFFARRVLLVEGSSERGALKYIPDLMNMDFDKEGLSVVDTDGKPGMVLVSQVLQGFGIPHVCLVDEDRGLPTGTNLTEQIKLTCGAENIFVMTPDFEGVVGSPVKLKPVDAMELFQGYTDISQVPEVMRRAISQALSL